MVAAKYMFPILCWVQLKARPGAKTGPESTSAKTTFFNKSAFDDPNTMNASYWDNKEEKMSNDYEENMKYDIQIVGDVPSLKEDETQKDQSYGKHVSSVESSDSGNDRYSLDFKDFANQN